MIKNIIIGILVIISILLSYTMIALRQGEKVVEVKVENYKDNPNWTTYKSIPLGIEIVHPKNLIATEESDKLILKNSTLELVISRNNNSSINDFVKWTPLTHEIFNYAFDDDKTRSHVVIIYEKEKLADPISYAKHIITTESSRDTLIIDTTDQDPLTYEIINTIKLIK